MRLVNLRTWRGPYVYVGRALKFHREHGRLEASPLANPYSAHKYPVMDCLRMYREWLWQQIQAKDESILWLLRSVNRDTCFACWCIELQDEAIFTEPERCHGQIIFKAARWLQESER